MDRCHSLAQSFASSSRILRAIPPRRYRLLCTWLCRWVRCSFPCLNKRNLDDFDVVCGDRDGTHCHAPADWSRSMDELENSQRLSGDFLLIGPGADRLFASGPLHLGEVDRCHVAEIPPTGLARPIRKCGLFILFQKSSIHGWLGRTVSTEQSLHRHQHPR